MKWRSSWIRAAKRCESSSWHPDTTHHLQLHLNLNSKTNKKFTQLICHYIRIILSNLIKSVRINLYKHDVLPQQSRCWCSLCSCWMRGEWASTVWGVGGTVWWRNGEGSAVCPEPLAAGNRCIPEALPPASLKSPATDSAGNSGLSDAAHRPCGWSTYSEDTLSQEHNYALLSLHFDQLNKWSSIPKTQECCKHTADRVIIMNNTLK